MSVITLIGVIYAAITSPELLTDIVFVCWALFSIADTLWINALRGKLINANKAQAVHGEWLVERSPVEAEFRCSECGYTYIDADSYAKAEYNYCPNCGAEMDGGHEDGK